MHGHIKLFLSTDLSEIRYHFTPLPDSDCNPTQYTIHQQDTETTREDLCYYASQVLKIPRTTLYNITIAGASGGRGVCNPSKGLGLKRTLKVELSAESKLSVLVGQKGTGPCDIVTDNLTCRTQLDNTTAFTCNQTWFNWLQNSTHYDPELVHNNLGGGGGEVPAW